MMTLTTYVVLDESGVYPVGMTNSGTQPVGSVAVDGLLPEQLADHMYVGGEFVLRPRLDVPEVSEASPGVLQMVMATPVGTTCVVYDTFTSSVIFEGVFDSGVLELTFEEVGGYAIEVTPPKPYMPFIMRLEHNG